MASTPSASALSAVLRCRGNIWARNPPTKRPATSGYSLGLGGEVVRDSPAERARSKQASVWEAFLQGEGVVVGRGLTVAYKSHRADALVSEVMCLKLAVLCRSSNSSSSSPNDAPHQVQEENDALQASGHIHSPTDLTSTKENSSSGQRITEDRPD